MNALRFTLATILAWLLGFTAVAIRWAAYKYDESLGYEVEDEEPVRFPRVWTVYWWFINRQCDCYSVRYRFNWTTSDLRWAATRLCPLDHQQEVWTHIGTLDAECWTDLYEGLAYEECNAFSERYHQGI